MGQPSTDRLVLLYRLSQTFNSSLDLAQVLNLVMDQVIETTRAERGFLMLRDTEGQLTFRVARGMDQQTVDAPAFQISRAVVERVAEDGKPQLTTAANLGSRSILCVPLQIKGELLGVIYVDSWLQAGVFTSEDLDLLATIAASAAIAIENARLYRDAQERLLNLHLLRAINSDLTSTLDLHNVLTTCLHRVQEALGVETASILTVQGNDLVFQVAIGEKAEQLKPFRVPIGSGIAGWVAQNARGTFTNDVRRDSRFYSNVDAGTGFTTHALMAAPLIVNKRVIGVIEVSNKLGNFTEADLDLLATIAASAAIAIENARLYEDTVRSADELRRLYETSLDITGQLEIGKLLQLIIERAADLLKADSGNYLFYDAQLDELIPAAPFGRDADTFMVHMKPGEGASGRVFLSGQPLIIQDYDEWEGRPAKIPLGRFGRVLHVPVKRGDEVVGIMSVNRSKSAPPYTADDQRLLSLFANQAAIAIENARLFQASIEKGKIERELQVAFDVQSSLIPRETPDIPGWEFAPLWRPARVVGGDFYDFINLAKGAESSQGLVIADVSDKGMGAALFMALSRSIVRASAIAATSPSACITQANRLICDDAANGMFVTLFYAQLDSVKGELTYVNAGHNPPLLYHAEEDNLIELTRTGLVLGINPDCVYDERSVRLNEGDFVVLYTDGVTDASNAQEQAFGDENLRRIILERRHASAAEMVAAIDQALRDFIGAAAQFDDITVMVAKRT